MLRVPDKPPRGLTNVLLMRRIVAYTKEPEPWTAVVRWDRQVLGFAHENICPLALLAKRARGFETTGRQKHRISDDNGSDPQTMRQIGEAIDVFHTPQAPHLREGDTG